MSFTSSGAPFELLCIDAQSADETLGVWINARGYANVTFYVYGLGTISGGVVTFEEAGIITNGTTPRASIPS